MNSSLRIIVTGLIAQHPCLGGVTWDYIQYVLGLVSLGHDVYYVEDSGEWPYNLDGGPSGNDWVAHDCSFNIRHLEKVMSRFGLAHRWAYRFPITGQWFGLSDAKRLSVFESAELIINVSGTLEKPEEYKRKGRLIYIDSDPVFTQVKLARNESNFCQRIKLHETHFSFGECLSNAAVPKTEFHWRPTRQPIVISEWKSLPATRNILTTVMSWTSYKPLVYQGKTYGQKDVEFRQFLDLPSKVAPVALEVALGKTEHVDWETDAVDLAKCCSSLSREEVKPMVQDLLLRAGWHVVDAMEVCSNLDDYRQYVQTSTAEWSVAKNGYVDGQPGWFSCRSACYLAAGKPVIVQDTGFGAILPVGEGIVPFRTADEAAVAIREVKCNYERHAEAARKIAEEYFDSHKVLSRLIEEAMGSDN